jgi:uncharacterized Ntn-hydrolase superfamily protein
MKRIFKITVTVIFFASCFLKSYATWSIIVIDPKTKQIGIAGASCTQSVYGIGAIIPGKGAVVVPAMSNYAARVKGLKLLMADTSPDEILKAMMDPEFDPEHQQYAVISLKYVDKPVTYTGSETNDGKGAANANGISVQGNTLTNADDIQAILNTAIKAQKDSLPIEEVLMLALETGSKLGGDKRCGTTKASSAFLIVAKPNDDPKKFSLKLIVTWYW